MTRQERYLLVGVVLLLVICAGVIIALYSAAKTPTEKENLLIALLVGCVASWVTRKPR